MFSISLRKVDRKPIFIDDEKRYKEYLFDISLPILYSDDRTRLLKQVSEIIGLSKDLVEKTTEELKDILEDVIRNKRTTILEQQIKDLKEYKNYNDIITTFNDIKSNLLYDAPLMLEWNTWRAMTMLDGGNIKANLKLDDKGQPMSTAQGNIADIICDYTDFGLTVEVTMQSGQKQYEMEGESVSLNQRSKNEGKKEIRLKSSTSCSAVQQEIIFLVLTRFS